MSSLVNILEHAGLVLIGVVLYWAWSYWRKRTAASRQTAQVEAWYAQWRMAKMRTTPGCTRTRKLASVSGWAKHAVLYEFTSLEARNRHFIAHEDLDPEMKAWSDRIVQKLVHAPGSSTLACRLWSAAPG